MEEFFTDMRRCTVCILPETFPGIEFDVNGICNYCRDHEKVEVFGEEALKQFLSKFVHKGKEYDCIVTISGGRDSSYVLHQIVQKYRMRVLALTVDSGAITPEGYRNIDRITEILDVDHIWIKDDDQIRISKNNVKIKFHAWLRKPSINTIVPVLNVGDKTMNLRIFKYANQNGIPLVIGGNNIGNSSFEQEHFKTGFMGVFPDNRGVYSAYNKIKLSILFSWEFLKNYNNLYLSVFKEYFNGALIYFFESFLKPRGIIPLGFYDYIYWCEDKILSTIYNKLDWRGASDTTATWRIDDAAYPLIDYIYYNLVGFTEFDELYSKMIREGQISRDEALKRCKSDNKPRIQYLKNMFKELDVSLKEVDNVLGHYRLKLFNKIIKCKIFTQNKI